MFIYAPLVRRHTSCLVLVHGAINHAGPSIPSFVTTQLPFFKFGSPSPHGAKRTRTPSVRTNLKFILLIVPKFLDRMRILRWKIFKVKLFYKNSDLITADNESWENVGENFLLEWKFISCKLSA